MRVRRTIRRSFIRWVRRVRCVAQMTVSATCVMPSWGFHASSPMAAIASRTLLYWGVVIDQPTAARFRVSNIS